MSRIRVCFVGDCITSGQGDNRYLGWPGRVGTREAANGHDFTVYNLGIRSDTSVHIAARWSVECHARHSRGLRGALVFAFGINDATEEAGQLRDLLDESLALAIRMLTEAKRSWPCFWVGPAPVDESSQPARVDSGENRTKRNAVTARSSKAYADVAAKLDVSYLNVFHSLSAEPAWISDELVDGVYPNARGYDRMADLLCDWANWRRLLND